MIKRLCTYLLIGSLALSTLGCKKELPPEPTLEQLEAEFFDNLRVGVNIDDTPTQVTSLTTPFKVLERNWERFPLVEKGEVDHNASKENSTLTNLLVKTTNTDVIFLNRNTGEATFIDDFFVEHVGIPTRFVEFNGNRIINAVKNKDDNKVCDLNGIERYSSEYLSRNPRWVRNSTIILSDHFYKGIFATDIIKGETRRLTRARSQELAHCPDLSPNGDRIAYIIHRWRDTFTLEIGSIDDLVYPTKSCASFEGSYHNEVVDLRWLNQETLFICTSAHPVKKGESEGVYEDTGGRSVYTYNTNTTNLTRFKFPSSTFSDWTLSPDGEYFVFESSCDNTICYVRTDELSEGITEVEMVPLLYDNLSITTFAITDDNKLILMANYKNLDPNIYSYGSTVHLLIYDLQGRFVVDVNTEFPILNERDMLWFYASPGKAR